MDTAKEVTAIYAQRIVDAIKKNTDADGLFLTSELLKEYGAKAWWAGRKELAEQIAKIA